MDSKMERNFMKPSVLSSCYIRLDKMGLWGETKSLLKVFPIYVSTQCLISDDQGELNKRTIIPEETIMIIFTPPNKILLAVKEVK